jgi:hypothetical protein
MKRVLYFLMLASLAVAPSCQRARQMRLEAEAAAAQPDAESAMPDSAATFNFADDAVGKQLAKTLPPQQALRLPPTGPSEPKPRAGSPVVERPELALPAPKPGLPVRPAKVQSRLRPHLVGENLPLSDFRADPQLPQRPEMPPEEMIQLTAPDANLPAALPPHGKQVADRAPLDDPTSEFSAERAVAHPTPLRTTPMPFMRINLPEPFEHRSPAKPLDREPPLVAPVPAPPK